MARQFSAVSHLLWSGPASSDKRGRDAKVIDWLDELTAECPKQNCSQYERPVRCEVSAIAESAVM